MLALANAPNNTIRPAIRMEIGKRERERERGHIPLPYPSRDRLCMYDGSNGKKALDARRTKLVVPTVAHWLQ